MRVEYTLSPIKNVSVQGMEFGERCIIIDDSKVCIIVDNNIIKELLFIFEKINYSLIPFPKNKKRINFDQKTIKQKLHKLCSYISNKIYTESNIDAIDCSKIKNLAPKLIAENEEEKIDISTHPPLNIIIFTTSSSIVNDIILDNYTMGYKYEKAYTAYADGLRANSIFTRYVQTYKAIEAIIGDKEIDDKVSKITKIQNPKLDKSHFGKLRQLRNRCEHPHQSKGHLSSSDTQDIKEIEKNLPDLVEIAKILFKNIGVKKYE